MHTSLKKIAILSGHNEYQTHLHFEEGLKKALERKGVETHIYPFSINYQRESIHRISLDTPDALISFCLFSLNDRSLSFSDIFGIPNITICLASGIYSLHQAKNPLDFVAFVDRKDQKRYQEALPGKTLFLPHAVDRDLIRSPTLKRPIEYVFFGTLFDHESRRSLWDDKLPRQTIRILNEAIENFSVEKGYDGSLLEVLEENSKITESDFLQMYHELELYLRGSLRKDFLLKNRDLPIHIYGKSDSHRNWEDVFKVKNAFIYHSEVPFSETLKLMKQTKYLIHHCPSFNEGLHERILTGLALGCAIITEPSSYLEKEFPVSCGVMQSATKNREAFVENGQAHILENHTWDIRVEALLDSNINKVDRNYV